MTAYLQRTWVQWSSAAALIAYAVVIAWLSLSPSPVDGVGSDKLQHMAAYSLFMLMTAPIVLVGTGSRLWAAGGAVFLYGVALELCQALVPGRYPEVLDAVANALGVLLGGLMVYVAWRVLVAREPRLELADS